MAPFDPDKDIPSLEGKVIFVTGGTAGLGRMSILKLAAHKPAHIYFSGRNASAAQRLQTEVRAIDAAVQTTFVQMDLSSLASVRDAVKPLLPNLTRLDVLLCNAGIMAKPPCPSKEGFETHFATNHLGHAMLIRQLLPTLLATAKVPGADVRVVILTSEAWKGHPREGISYAKLTAPRSYSGLLGPWFAYAQSKFANVIYAAELARRFPSLLSVAVHPGVVETELVTGNSLFNRAAVYIPCKLSGIPILKPEQGCHSQLWVSVAGRRDDMVNGALYLPVAEMANGTLDKTARDPEQGRRLWEWTEKILDEHN